MKAGSKSRDADRGLDDGGGLYWNHVLTDPDFVHEGYPSLKIGFPHSLRSIYNNEGPVYFIFLIFTYLLGCARSSLQRMGSLVGACELLVTACEISYPEQKLKPGPPALEAWGLSHWTTIGKSSYLLYFYFQCYVLGYNI